MGSRAAKGSAVVGLALTVLMGCTASPSPPTPAAASLAPSVGVAPRPVTPPPPSPTQTSVPTSSAAWVKHDVPEFTTAGGGDLATTVGGDTEFIHVVVSNLEDAWPGYIDASVYLRTRNEGKAWGERLLIGGISPRIAAAGRDVYLAFLAYGCGGGAGVLRNSDHGRRGAWSALTCMTRNRTLSSDRAPAVAATGNLLYVAYVDDRTLRAAVRISRDHGKTWTRVDLGDAATGDDLLGIIGDVQVAAAGNFAAVAWSDHGAAVARMSVDAGVHWGRTTPLANGRATSASARGSRLAFAGTDTEGSRWAFTWTETEGWRALALPDAGSAAPVVPYAVSVAVGPAETVAVMTCSSGSDSRWTSSVDGGVTWRDLDPPPECAAGAPIVWIGDQRAVLLVGGEESYAIAVHP